jgi:hypothetical protein
VQDICSFEEDEFVRYVITEVNVVVKEKVSERIAEGITCWSIITICFKLITISLQNSENRNKSLIKQQFFVIKHNTILQEMEKLNRSLNRPTLEQVMFLRKYNDKQFLVGTMGVLEVCL